MLDAGYWMQGSRIGIGIAIGIVGCAVLRAGALPSGGRPFRLSPGIERKRASSVWHGWSRRRGVPLREAPRPCGQLRGYWMLDAGCRGTDYGSRFDRNRYRYRYRYRNSSRRRAGRRRSGIATLRRVKGVFRETCAPPVSLYNSIHPAEPMNPCRWWSICSWDRKKSGSSSECSWRPS